MVPGDQAVPTRPPVPPGQVLVTSRSFSTGDLDLGAELAAAGASVVSGPVDHELSALRPLLADTVAWIAGTAPISAQHLDAAPQLRLVARYGVGVDAVDHRAAAERGIAVTNTPGANSGAVADHTIALMLAALRQVVRGDRKVRAGDWRLERTRQLGQLTVGIIGVGRVGQAVAERLAGFGCRMLGHDPGVPAEVLRSVAVEPVGLRDLARHSDVITLHSPGDRPLVDAAWLAAVKRGLILVNTARASLVDEPALAAALTDGQVKVYAADTVSGEAASMRAGSTVSSLVVSPLPVNPLPVSPLLAPGLIDRTIFTPHTAAQTVEAVDAMGRGAVAAVFALFAGTALPNVVAPPAELGDE